MSSVGAVSAAGDSRGISADKSNEAYRFILPPLPTGVHALNSVFLHGDIGARPYRIEDFKDGLGKAGVLGDIAACGSYQMNHVWMVTLKSLSAKQKLVNLGAFEAKGRRCVVIDPNKSEVRLKLHWIPFHLPDETVKKALERYGKVEDITRETWRVNGFEGVQSTTRVARLTLKDGVSTEHLPHQLRLPGGTALVVAPGRVPQCLRCRQTGHIRKECRTPRCDSCRRFGHTRDECRKTYADVTNAVTEDETAEHVMDQAEAEEAAGGNPENVISQGNFETTTSTLAHIPKTPAAKKTSTTDDVGVPGPKSREPVSCTSIWGLEHENNGSEEETDDISGGKSHEDIDHDMEGLNSAAKRPLESATAHEHEELTELQTGRLQRWQMVTSKRGRRNASPRGSSESQKVKDSQ